jgi:hypothetical protein
MTLENLFKVGLIVMFTAVWLAAVRWVWTHQLDPVATVQRLMQKPFKAPEWVATREPNRIYQNGNVVAEVTGAVEENGSIMRFAQISNTSALNQAVVFQYQRHNLRIREVGSAIGMKTEMHVSGSGATSRTLTAVLENIVCEKVQ